jgi:hypothetical protein
MIKITVSDSIAAFKPTPTFSSALYTLYRTAESTMKPDINTALIPVHKVKNGKASVVRRLSNLAYL